jgi:thioredoxin 1
MNNLIKLNQPKLVSSIASLVKSSRFVRHVSSSKVVNSNIFNVQDTDDFKKRVLDNSRPVIVDFHAGWCGPCKVLGPRLEKLMATYVGKADFAKVDIDDCFDLAEKYSVNSIPTVIAIKGGKEIAKFTGLIDEDKMKQFVKTACE